jgi:PAS domain S-box-containing protein
MENQMLIDSQKTDITNLIKLQDISVETIQNLEIHALTASIANAAPVFANMDAAILWLKGDDDRLHLKDVSPHIEKEFIPETLPVENSFMGRSIIDEGIIETVNLQEAECLKDVIRRYGFLYVAAVPLIFKGFVDGCITLLKRKDFFLAEADKAIISLFASQSAAALQTARLYGELLEQMDLSDAIFSNIQSGIMVFDHKGLLLKINQSGAEILHIDSEEMIGRRITDIYPEVNAMLLTDRSLGREIHVSVPDKGSIPIGYVSSSLQGMAQEKSGIIVLFKDLTEIKKLQTELNRKQRFEAMGKVIAGVAHEIRNPLFGISSVVQILQREVRSGSHQELLNAMYREVNRLNNLVGELLVYSRDTKLDIAEIDINMIMDKIKHYVYAKKSNLNLHLKVNPSEVIRADMDKVTQVFLNVIDNAIGAGSSNIEIISYSQDEKIVIRIKDDGAGIPPESLERLFDPFFTTKKEGTGLGLSICRKLIEDHGGSIDIISTEGEGTTVILMFNTY